MTSALSTCCASEDAREAGCTDAVLLAPPLRSVTALLLLGLTGGASPWGFLLNIGNERALVKIFTNSTLK
jgi:hypothetical protein